MHFEFVCVCLTVSDDRQDSQVHLPLPVGAFLQSDAVTRGGEDVPEHKHVQTHTHTHSDFNL